MIARARAQSQGIKILLGCQGCALQPNNVFFTDNDMAEFVAVSSSAASPAVLSVPAARTAG